MHTPLVSVILPVYNSEAIVGQAIRSVLHQTLPDFELIVINDGSTDSTREAIAESIGKDVRLRVYHREHSGVAGAFNAGLEIARGKYIARMDADDVMHADRLQKQFDFLEEHSRTGVVSCLVNYGGDRNTQEGYARHVDWINTLITHQEISLNRFVDSPVCNPSVMFRRELVEQHGGARDGDFPEDYEMWLRWMEAGVQFAKVPEELFTWNDLPSRLTRNDERYSSPAFERAKTKYLVNFIRTRDNAQRPVYLCGTGRITRRKSDFLVSSGLQIGGYIDIDPVKIGTHYNNLPIVGLDAIPRNAYIVNYVSVRGAREGLRELFGKQGLKEGDDFISAG